MITLTLSGHWQDAAAMTLALLQNGFRLEYAPAPLPSASPLLIALASPQDLPYRLARLAGLAAGGGCFADPAGLPARGAGGLPGRDAARAAGAIVTADDSAGPLGKIHRAAFRPARRPGLPGKRQRADRARGRAGDDDGAWGRRLRAAGVDRAGANHRGTPG